VANEMTALPSRTDDAVAFLTERAQAEADERAEAAWERQERIERSITFDDLLEAMTELSDAEKQEYMLCLARATRLDASQMFYYNELAKAKVIARKIQEDR
jgi:hypothetical protein